MAIDFEEENEEELDWAALNERDDDNETLDTTMLVGISDYIVHEIRQDPRFEKLFRMANSLKNDIVDVRKAAIGTSNSEASATIVDNTEALIKMHTRLEKIVGEDIEKVDYYTYIINGTEFTQDDLEIINSSQEEYDLCFDDAVKMKKSLKGLDKELRKIRLGNALSLNRNFSFKSEEYQLSCLQVEKQTKLEEDEDFLRKYDFVNSLTGDQFALLREFFGKSVMIGNAVETLEKNGREKKELESKAGQVDLLKRVFEENIAKNEYEALLQFIDEARVKVSAKGYDSSEVRVDDSELGILIRRFVEDLARNRKDARSVEIMFDDFKELDSVVKKQKEQEVKVEEEVAEEQAEEAPAEESKNPFKPLEFEKIEDKKVFEDAVKKEKVEEPKTEETEQEKKVKAIENDMIVSCVLEKSKFKDMMQKIRDREEKIYQERRKKINQELDKKMKSQHTAESYIEDEKAKLAGLLETTIEVDEDGCFFGDLYMVPSDVEFANIDEKGYEELLDQLDQIKKDEKAIEKDIKMNRKSVKKSGGSDFVADVAVYKMQKKKDEVHEARLLVEGDIKVSEFFAGLTTEELHRTVLFVGAIGEKNRNKEEIEKLADELTAVKSEVDRLAVMKQAFVELVKEGIVSKEQHKELMKYIREYQKGFESGKYKVISEWEREESAIGEVVYDYLDFMEENIDTIKKHEEQVKSTQTAAPKGNVKREQDDDGDIII
jgi:hypothetical protein